MTTPLTLAAPILEAAGITIATMRAAKLHVDVATRRAVIMALSGSFSTIEIAAFVGLSRSSVARIIHGKGEKTPPERAPLPFVGRGMRDAPGNRDETCAYYSMCLGELVKREDSQGREAVNASCQRGCAYYAAIGRHDGLRLGDRMEVVR